MAKEISKQYQHYYRGSASELLEVLKTSTIRGEWVVIIKSAGKSTEGSLSLSQIFQMDLPPKVKAKLLAELSDRSVKEWYQELVGNKEKR